MRKRHILALAAAFGAAGLAMSVDTSGAVAKAGPKMACATKHGKGWAPTEDMARFQAWEIVAQTTGNWPIQTDTFKNERYSCKPDSSGYTCYSKIDVCKAG